MGDPATYLRTEQVIDGPDDDLREYQFRVDRARLDLVRDRLIRVLELADEVVRSMTSAQVSGAWPTTDQWDLLQAKTNELQRLSTGIARGRARWADLARHLYFREESDLRDIITADWPSVRAEVEEGLYAGYEPIRVGVEDLASLTAVQPTGPVTTALKWQRLSDVEFERLLFELLRTTKGYENVEWLMKTKAADGGRDINAETVVVDQLTGTDRLRTIVQCKHWLTKSIGRDDIVLCIEAVRTWEPPKVDILIVATSGRFSQAAVRLVENRNRDRDVPRVILWAESHLEGLLGDRPDLVAVFRLR